MNYTKEESEKFMRAAIEAANEGGSLGEVPIGAVIVKNGKIIAKAHNRRVLDSDPTAHCEIVALRNAGKVIGVWNLSGCDLFVTIEPCAMCSGAIVNSRIDNVYFGANDKRFGYCGTLGNIAGDERLNHRAVVTGGILEKECLELVVNFFKEKRQNK